MSEPDDDSAERFSNLAQRLGDALRLVETMKVTRSPGGMDSASLDAARAIEDMFAQHFPGGRTQRLARIQVTIRDCLERMLSGEVAWRAQEPQEPTA